MKWLGSIGILIILCISSASTVKAQVDSCLELWPGTTMIYPPPDTLAWNPDSVMLDTCTGGRFAKRLFEVTFLYYVLSDSLTQNGDTIDRNWRDIDSKYSGIRDGFSSLEQKFGPFTLKHILPDLPFDTSKFFFKAWYVNFINFVNIDTAVFNIRKIPTIDTIWGRNDFSGSIRWLTKVKEKHSMDVELWPQPCNKELFIRTHKELNNIFVYNQLGNLFKLPIRKFSGIDFGMDISTLTPGIYYFELSNKFFKILVQR